MMSPLEMIRSPREAIRQNWTLAKFLVVGASGSAVYLVSLTLLTTVLGSRLILVSNAIALELSILSNFFLNDKFTFNSITAKSTKPTRLAKYNLVSLLGFGVNELTVAILAPPFEAHHISYIFAALIAILISFSANYVGSSRWAWRHREKTDHDASQSGARVSKAEKEDGAPAVRGLYGKTSPL
jgi:putative flippase GtrA